MECGVETKLEIGGDERGRRLKDHRHPQGEAGVVTAAGLDGGRPARDHIDGLLGPAERGRRPNGDSKHHIVAVGDPPVEAAVVVGPGPAGGVKDHVIVISAAQGRSPESGAEFEALDPGDGEQKMPEDGLERIEKRLAQADRQTHYGTGDDSAQRIARRGGHARRDGLPMAETGRFFQSMTESMPEI